MVGLALALVGLARATLELTRAIDPPAPAGGSHPATAAFRAVPVLDPIILTRGAIYPYSVIPGGARSRAELLRAINSDKVVAAHYDGFRADHAEATHAAGPRPVHVSYRIGGKVYWTRRKITLRPGEPLLTDGTTETRARCGNRIADELLGETSELEPAELVLDTPVISAADVPTPAGVTPLQAYSLFAGTAALPPSLDGGLPIGAPAPWAGGGFLPGFSPEGVPGGRSETATPRSVPSGGGTDWEPPDVPEPPDGGGGDGGGPKPPTGPEDGVPGHDGAPGEDGVPGEDGLPGQDGQDEDGSDVPEPVTLALFATGGATLGLRRVLRRRPGRRGR
jgi:hypothetical protein